MALSDLFQIEFSPGELSEIEREYERELRDLYDNDAWFWANSVKKRFSYDTDKASLFEHSEKISQGPLIRARVLKRHTEILDCSFTGWYHGVRPLDALERIESSIKKLPCEEDVVLAGIKKAYTDWNIEIDQCTPSDFEMMVFKAIEKPPIKTYS